MITFIILRVIAGCFGGPEVACTDYTANITIPLSSIIAIDQNTRRDVCRIYVINGGYYVIDGKCDLLLKKLKVIK